MITIHKVFLQFLIWMMETEHQIGFSTGMNHRYLSALRQSIRDHKTSLQLLEINHESN